MTDITDIHRIAFARVEEACGIPAFEEAWAEVRKLLPSELTNPQHVLPTEPGPYLSSHNVLVELRDGEWSMQGHRQSVEEVSTYAPLRRLVPERPQITREQIRSTLGPLLTNVMNYPEEVSTHMLGRDFSGLITKATDALDTLVNGTEQ